MATRQLKAGIVEGVEAAIARQRGGVEVGSNTSTVALRAVGDGEKGTQ
jgi:hypothetical protein